MHVTSSFLLQLHFFSEQIWRTCFIFGFYAVKCRILSISVCILPNRRASRPRTRWLRGSLNSCPYENKLLHVAEVAASVSFATSALVHHDKQNKLV